MVRFAMMLASIYQMIERHFKIRREIRESLRGETPKPYEYLERDVVLPAGSVQPTTICDMIRAEHRGIERSSSRARNALLMSANGLEPKAPEELAKIHDLLVAHCAKEEMVLFPPLRAALSDPVSQMAEEHRAILALDRRVGELLGVPLEIQDRQWLTEFREAGLAMLDALQNHISREEVQVLRPAGAALGIEDQQRLAAELATPSL